MARRRPGSGAAGAKRLLPALRSVRRGDFSGHLAADQTGVAAEIAEAFNDVVELMDSLTKELERISRVVGKEGSIKERASLPGASGAWAAWINAVNTLVDDLVRPIEEVAHVIGAVAKGDLSQRIPLETEGTPLKGEFLSIARTVNTMVDQLNSFASEVTRVAHEVGTEGRLGGQAQVKGVAGVWKDLTDNVNSMAANLTGQVRNIADVTTAVAKGNLSQKVTVDVKGEILELKNTINAMVDQLNSFGSEVTRVTREVGTEGKLESRAVVKGMAGVWKDLTDNVNEMIRNLRETTQKSTEQDWLKTNLAKFTQMLQGRRDLMTVAKLILSELAPVVSAQHGVFYLMEAEDGTLVLKLLSAYAYQERKGPSHRFRLGEGLVGQCALEKERILITDVPEDYIRISSGLGEAPPLNIVVLPVLFEGQVKAVIELASFNRFKDVHLNLLDQLTETIGVVLNTIEANMRTETLLRQSQSLAQELQSQQEELQETNARLQGQAYELQTSEELLKNRQEELKGANEELQSKAQQLAQQKAEVEAKNREIELANLTLEERAEQLAVASRYKSEFLANMSHELRTPLNSLLILAEMLASDQQGTMTPKQIEFASTIYSAGSDLLTLIDDILDMAKIESGTMVVEVGEARFTELRDLVERTFRPVAENKGLHFTIELADNLPKTISTDAKRLQQVLRNLLSNAFKFTEDGKVSLHVDIATKGWSAIHPVLSRAETVIAFAVSDTGVGIPPEKLNVVFEPFQQAEMGAARKYGGSGLGLSISRAITRLLGGEIRVQSTVAEGSTFTLYLPRTYRPLSEPTAALVSRPAERVARIDVVGAPRREVSFPPRPKRSEISDDYAAIASGDRVVLIVERDPKFAAVLLDTAHEQGFKAVIAPTGETGLALALQLLPNAITLDLRLPDLPGWVVLDRLKHDLTTRHIPVQLISSDSNIERGRKLGAFACLRKPVTREALDKAFARIKNFVARRMRTLLVVEDIAVERDSIMHMIGDGEIQVTAVGTAGEALAALQAQPYDCLLLDLRLPDLPGLELLEKVRKELDLLDLPVIVYTGKELSEDEEARLQQLAETVISKAPGALERVRETVGLFLHRVGTNRPTSNEQVAPEAPAPDQVLAHKKILAVDDDVRSLFAIASMLERWQMQVLRAESGREALAILDEMPDIDLVLMDIMMPYLDGYETIRRIRQQERFQYLPIIALTAKALKGDREKCLAAGASDYIAKPVKVEQLQALLHVWLDRPAPGESPLNRF